MRKVFALVRASWLTAISYRVDTFFSFMNLLVAIIPLYFISRALQPMMAGAIRAEAPEYFGFVLVGMLTFSFVATAVGAVHGALSSEISSGSFEALMSTPTSLPVLIVGMVGQAFSMTAIRAAVVFATACVLGAHVVWTGGLAALFILALIIFCYLAIGILAAALVLAFRTTGPFPTAVLTVSALLGGVYYPTNVIPAWLERFSVFVPLTYGLRALRRSLLDGASLMRSANDVAILTAWGLVLTAAAMIAFTWAVRYAKRAGTLAQY